MLPEYLHYVLGKELCIAQWALEPQIDIKSGSMSWHNINRPDFYALLKYKITNIICTSTHEVNIMSRVCLENDHWQQNLVKTNFGLKTIWDEFFKMSM